MNEKKKKIEVPQLVKHVSTVNRDNPKEYINLSDSVESATVAQLVEYLPDEQESPQTSGFELFHENPGRGAYIAVINAKYKIEQENGM